MPSKGTGKLQTRVVHKASSSTRDRFGQKTLCGVYFYELDGDREATRYEWRLVTCPDCLTRKPQRD